MDPYATLKEYVVTHGVELVWRIGAALGIVLVAILAARLARSGVSRTLHARAGEHRAATLAPAVQSLTRISILGVGFVMAASQVGLNVSTVLAGAGVLGLAVGFGAQTLVRDVISGFFLIVDGVVEADDHITFDQVSGTVEEIGLRMTRVRALDGQLWYVPNGELKIVGNFNRDWARAIVNIPLPHEQNVREAMGVVQDTADQWASENTELVIEPPEVQGVMAVTPAGVNIRVRVKVKAMQHWAVERELGHRVKEALDAAGVPVPIPRQVVYHRGESIGHTGT